MNMKKITLITVSVLLAATSAFAWSKAKKYENTGNLGRTYVSIGGAVDTSKYAIRNTEHKKDATGAYGEFAINVPVFKPGVNSFRKIKWAGCDANAFFNYSYNNDIALANVSVRSDTYSVGCGLTPYLNVETKLPFLKAIKPFGIAYCGYQWNDLEFSAQGASDKVSADYFIYGVGGGVEFVVAEGLSFTPTWQWRGNAEEGNPCYQVITAELTYWFTTQFSVSAFWMHNIGYDDVAGWTNNGQTGVDLKHADIIGLRFRIGFLR